MRSNIKNWISGLTRAHIICILGILGLLAYTNAINHPFVHDDVVFIQHNPDIGELDLSEIFIPSSDTDNKLSLVNKYYRPLLDLINRLLFKVAGFNPHGYHFFNVLLHIIISFQIFAVIRRLIENKGLALVSAILFLLHPVQNEAVACVSGISNLVFAFFCLLSFDTYLISRNCGNSSRKHLLYTASLACFLLALFSKEQSVVLPFLIVAYEFIFSTGPRMKTLKSRGWAMGGYFLTMAAYFILRKILFGFALTRPSANNGELWLWLFAIPRSLLTYLGLLFYPHDLHYYRSQDVLLPVLWPCVGLFLVILAIIFLLRLTPRPQKTWMTFGLAWFIVSLGPTLNILPLVNEYSLILTAEHFLYFPMAGMVLFVLAVVHYWLGKAYGKRTLIAFFAILFLSAIFIKMNIKQNAYWRGEIPLFKRTLEFEKDFGRVRLLLAKAYVAQGQYENAIREARRALAIMQDYDRKIKNEEVRQFYQDHIKDSRYHIGYCLDRLGDYEGALSEFKEILRTEPENAALNYSIGLSYVKLKDYENAAQHFEKFLTIEKENTIVMNALALCYKETGQYDKAETLLRGVARLDSASESAKKNLDEFLRKRQTQGF